MSQGLSIISYNHGHLPGGRVTSPVSNLVASVGSSGRNIVWLTIYEAAVCKILIEPDYHMFNAN